MAKSTDSEFKQRIYFVYGLLIQGHQRKSIIRYASEKYDVSERQIDTYISLAREIMHKDQKIDIEIKKSEIISQYYHLYQQSYDIEDYKECRSILAEISNIIGVKAATILELQGNAEKPLMMQKVKMVIKERKSDV